MSFNWLKTAFSTNQKKARTSELPKKTNTFRPRVLELEDRRVLTSLYLANTFSGSGSNLIFNAGRYDQVSGLTLGTNAFNSFSSAYSAASSGDTIYFGTGTYTVAANTDITKTLTLIGSQASATDKTPVTTLNPSSSTATDTGTTAGVLVVQQGVNLNISNMTIDGLAGTYNIGQFVRYESTGTSTINNVNFQNITGNFPAGFGKYDGIAVTVLDGVVNVSNSNFTNMGREGIVYSGSAVAGTVLNINYTGKGAGDNLDYGVEVNGGAQVIVTASYFRNCLGVASTDQSESAGLAVYDDGSSLKAYGNLFQNNANGIVDGFDGTDAPVLDAEYNNFIGNTLGVSTDIPTTGTGANLNNNFWGSVAGAQTTGANSILDAGLASTFTTSLYKPTWVWNGLSVSEYLTNTSFFAVGNEIGDNHTPATVKVFAGTGATANVLGNVVNNQNGILQSTGSNSFFPYGSGYLGGVSVAIGDINGDFRPDLIVGDSQGDSTTNAHVKVYDIATGQLLASFFAFNVGFNGGVNVAAGDINGDFQDEIIVGKGADKGGAAGAALKVFEFTGINTPPTAVITLQKTDIFPGYNGGISVAAGDITKTGNASIVVGSIVGGSSYKVYNYTAGTGAAAAGDIPSGSTLTFIAGSSTFVSPPAGMGIYVGVGDLTGTGYDQIIIGSGQGAPQAHVLTYSYQTGSLVQQASFFAYEDGFTGGVRVASANVRGTASPEILVGEGPGRTSTGNGDVRVFSATGTQTLPDFTVFNSLLAGVNVG